MSKIDILLLSLIHIAISSGFKFLFLTFKLSNTVPIILSAVERADSVFSKPETNEVIPRQCPNSLHSSLYDW